MNSISFNDLLNEIKKYNANEEDISLVKKAFSYASFYHDGQKRDSGEDYIIHPLNVAYILAVMHADIDTLCAALLHDTLEDTKATKEEIENEFNSDIASLVDGVSNIKDLNFSTIEEVNYANTRKIITGITKDVRIIIIKIADRLHNMRTLNYKKQNKQQEKALETMEIYVPFAYYIGAYRIKSELEDLAFKYLKPNDFERLNEQRNEVGNKYLGLVNEMALKVENILKNKSIPYSIRIRIKNVYGIYQKMNEGKKLSDIHDLLALKVIVDDIDNCYRTLGVIHSIYKPMNSKFRDYICNPKTNMYQSLHTTVYTSDRFIHSQIRTYDMDKIASFGLPAFWDMKKGNARSEMQKELSNKCQFFNSLVQIDSMFSNNEEFINSVKSEVFSDKVYVYTPLGTVVELPKGATIVDYAYKVNEYEAPRLIKALVNDEEVTLDYVLKTKDRVKLVLSNQKEVPHDNWELYAQTSSARKLILQNKGN